MRKTRDAFHLNERTPLAVAKRHFTSPFEYQTDANLGAPGMGDVRNLGIGWVMLGIPCCDKDWLCSESALAGGWGEGWALQPWM